MKKPESRVEEMRAEYRREDLGPLVRGKYSARYSESSNVVVIDHGGQFATVYAHQSGMNVRVGDAVVRGQIIGRVGSTGYSTGPHLHFEIKRRGAQVNPTRYLDREFAFRAPAPVLPTATG